MRAHGDDCGADRGPRPKEDGRTCSVFAFDVAANGGRLPLARNAVRKLKTLRHPGVVRVLESIEVSGQDFTPTNSHADQDNRRHKSAEWANVPKGHRDRRAPSAVR